MDTKASEKALSAQEREKIIVRTSGIGIAANILTAAVKIIVGTLTSSMAIVSEGINNATDCLTSALTLIGSKLAGKHPDARHPFGYGRIEYIASLFIGMFILYSGISVLAESVKLVVNPEPVSTTLTSLIIVAAVAVLKFILGKYTVRMGKATASEALEAVGKESLNDSIVSVATIVSVVVFLLTGKSFDAWVAIITASLIIKTGAEVLFASLGEIIGRPGEKELADTLYRKIRETGGIINAADMMLHNYGPGKWSGSVNIEVSKNLSAEEIYAFVHPLQLDIMHEYSVTMVFGIYAVDTTSPESIKLRQTIADFVQKEAHIISYHAVFDYKKENTIYCDLVVDYELKDWDKLRADFTEHIGKTYPDKKTELTVETEFV